MNHFLKLTALSSILILGACGSDSNTQNDGTDVSADIETNEATVTPEEYNELNVGMTYEEVTAIVGGTEDNKTENGVSEDLIMYHYDGENGVDEDSTVTLIFNEDKLESIMESGLLTTAEDTDDDTNEATVTPEEYNKLKVGMTYEEVTAIVGGTEDNRTENGVSEDLVMYHYDGENGIDEDSTITLIFNKDKLETIMESGLLTAAEEETE